MAGTFTTRNSPIAAADGGFQQAELEEATLLSDLLTIPPQANSAWLQVPTGTLLFRMDGDVAGGEWLSLPALAFLPLTNRQELTALVLDGGVTVGVQFFEGTLGPMPPAPIVNVSTGGVPGDGTVTSVDFDPTDTGFEAGGVPITTSGTIQLIGRARVDTGKTVHVMVTGNDADALRERLDKPFYTIAAAAAVLEDGDTLHIWAGTYEEGNITIPVNATIELHGANVDVPGVGIAWGIRYEGETLSIRGAGRITHVGDSGDVPLIVAVNEDSSLYIDIDRLENGMGTLISSPGGLGNRLFVKAEMIATNNSNTAVAISGFSYMRIDGHLDTFGLGRAILIDQSGTLDLYAGVDSASATTGNVGTVAINNATGNLYGYITAASMAVSCTSGVVNNYGAVIGLGTEPAFFVNTSTDCKIYGSVTTQDITAVVIRESECDIYGSLYAESAFALNVIRPGSLVRLHGSAQNFGTEPAISLAADTTLYVYGDVFSQEQAAIDLGTWIDNTFGALYIYGTVRSAENIAVLMGDGNLFHYGRITSDVGYAIGTTATSVGGRMRLAGLVETFAAQGPIICATGTHVIDLMANARLEGAGTYTIEYGGGTASVNSYLASGTQDIDPAIAINGSFNVIL